MNPQQKKSVCPLPTRIWQSVWAHMDLDKLCCCRALWLMGLKRRDCCSGARAKCTSSESSRSCRPGPVFCCAVGGLAGPSSAQCWIPGRRNLLRWLDESVELGCEGLMRGREISDEARWCIPLPWDSQDLSPLLLCCPRRLFFPSSTDTDDAAHRWGNKNTLNFVCGPELHPQSKVNTVDQNTW